MNVYKCLRTNKTKIDDDRVSMRAISALLP
jgi:hypothetical protein